jgi:RNA polymerase sigma factor (TIGR02999 family)
MPEPVMGMQPEDQVTRLLSAWTGGDRQALDELIPLVYGELHRIAKRAWGAQKSDHTLQPTVLIHEAYLKLVGQGERTFQSRTHFFAVASMAMRQVLVNHAEASLAQKRGGGAAIVPLQEADEAVHREAREVLALHDALERLAELDRRKAQVVELRYFGGLSIEETAEALGISTITVTRDWQAARAWLARELGASQA